MECERSWNCLNWFAATSSALVSLKWHILDRTNYILDFTMVTSHTTPPWWNRDTAFSTDVNDQRMLVIKMMTVSNIQRNVTENFFVTDIRHQHLCSPMIVEQCDLLLSWYLLDPISWHRKNSLKHSLSKIFPHRIPFFSRASPKIHPD